MPTGIDFLYFQAGNFNADELTPAYGTPTPGGNEFTLAHTYETGDLDWKLDFNFMNERVEATVTSLSEVKSAIEAKYGASEFSSEESNNVLSVLRESSEFRWTVYSADDDSIDIKSNSSKNESTDVTEDSLLISDVETSRSRLLRAIDKQDSTSTFAVGGSVDVRDARQHSMSVSGNASMSARLVSLPAPPDFLEKIKEYFN